MISKKPANIDEYIFCFPENVQLQLQQVRKTIHHTMHEAQETNKFPLLFLISKDTYFNNTTTK